MRIVLAALALLAAACAARAADDCTPPTFYTSLPRDQDYYYGVARDPDTELAREAAIRNLGRQAGAEVEGWSAERVAALAGPCRDKFQVAAGVGRLLPKSDLLSGWEQDDFARCGGFSYVLVRIEKERVARFLKESARFHRELADSLGVRVQKVEGRVDALTARLDRLEASLGRLPRGASTNVDADKLGADVAEMRANLKAGKPRADVERRLAAAEDSYARLEARMRGYQSARDAAEAARLSAQRAAKAPELKSLLSKLDAGTWAYPDAARVAGIDSGLKDYDSLRTFCRGLLSRPDRAKLSGHEDFFAYMIMVGDLSLKDDAATLRDGEAFLKNYPGSDMYEAVKAEMNGVIASARGAAGPAPASAVDAPDPCPNR